MGDSYTNLEDEAGVAADKTVELDATLGGHDVQYREVQGHKTEKFLSYFKPCIIPQEGGVASGFKQVEAEEYQTRLVLQRKTRCSCKRGSFCPIFTQTMTIFLFLIPLQKSFNSLVPILLSKRELRQALEVVQYIKDTCHDGKCEIVPLRTEN
ncbi:villin putative [Euphorbia peplus]|nr:villin putative [Euphorbia peplus]